MTIKLTFEIEPLGAVRMTTGQVRVFKGERYKPEDAIMKKIKRYLEYKEQIGWLAKLYAPTIPLDKAIEIKRLYFYMPIPKTWTAKKKAKCEGEKFPHTSKPDIDNLIKGVKDSLNGIIWEDDRLIYSVQDARKYYSDRPRIEIEIEQMG